MKVRNLTISAILFFGTLIVPLYLLWMVVSHPEDSSQLTYFCLYIIYIFSFFSWGATSVYMRFGWFGIMLAVLLYHHLWLIALLTVLFSFFLNLLMRRNFTGESLVIRAFSPLNLYVHQGGNTLIFNHHWHHPRERYALDFVGLAISGRRARGILPTKKEAYFCFSSPLYSPLSGTVLKAEDGLPDLEVGKMDPERPYGNFVIIQSAEDPNKQLVLAHMMNQSVAVNAGDTVQYGDLIGRIGNSGNTTEPHLHIHAQKVEQGKLKGIPLQIEGRYLMRNSLLRKMH